MAGLALLGSTACAVPETGRAGWVCPERLGAGAVWPPAAEADGPRARCVAERAGAAQVLYLGEIHDNPVHHAVQRRVVEALVERGARPALAFEMLPESQQAVAEAAVAGHGDREAVARALGWAGRGWPDFAMYWPLFELARRHRLPVVAADLEPATVREISRQGLASHGPAASRFVSLLPPDPAREARILATIRRAHCDLVPEQRLAGMVQGWHARNVVMARNIDGALGRAAQVVVIAGRGHQAEGGIPDQLAAVRPGVRQFVVALGEGGREEPGGAAARADLVWLTPAVERPDPCAGLRRQLGRSPSPPGGGEGVER